MRLPKSLTELGDMIVAGSKLLPQAFGVWIGEQDGWGGCALGAAYIEAGGLVEHKSHMDYPRMQWKVATPESHQFIVAIRELSAGLRVACPEKGCTLHRDPITVHHTIGMRLNDDHRWSREAIAEWLYALDREKDKVKNEVKRQGKEDVGGSPHSTRSKGKNHTPHLVGAGGL